ncbi:MAG: alanine--glyoxylate aminotransferase family protein [Spirochaetaceae bacterium]|nr:MAG: alanine--glyoxylate aminotransferase family protein [Spirochaetaceae bacterium]
MSHKKLFIPGPVEVDEGVLQKMATPMIGHRSAEWSALQKSVSEKLQKLMYTGNPIILSASSGTGLLEMAIRCTTAKRAIVFSVGAFGNRWHEIALGNGVPADKYEEEWGGGIRPETVDQYLSTGKYDVVTITHNETSTGVMNHLEELAEVIRKYPEVVWCVDAVSSLGGAKIQVDKLGIDICITSSQKALGLPPGLSLASVSEKAKKRASGIGNRGYYFDMLLLLKYVEERNFQYPSTPSISHTFALDFALDRILNQEGLDARFARHHEMADYVRAWAKRYFALFPKEEYASDTVTCISNTRKISVKDLNGKLGERGLTISNGYGALKEKTFRIAHMAELQKNDLEELLDHIEDVLELTD